MDKNVILAKKYGRAIYEIAAEQHCLEQTEEDLRLIADTIGKSKELGEILNHPLLAKDVKKDTINKLFADKVQPIVLQFCYVVIDKGRIADFAAMADVYANLAHHGRSGGNFRVSIDQIPGGRFESQTCGNHGKQNYHETESRRIFDRRIYGPDGRPSD